MQVAGIEKKNWRFLKTSFDTNFAIDPAVFEEAVKKDLEAGLVPAFLCATVSLRLYFKVPWNLVACFRSDLGPSSAEAVRSM